MTNSEQAHETLMQEWKHRHRQAGHRKFIADGPVDWEAWENPSPRILFLLKEAYDSDSDTAEVEWDYPDLIKREGSGLGPTIRCIAHWARLFAAWDENTVSFSESLKAEKDEESLLSVAIVNVKKSDGLTESCDEDLRAYLGKDIDLLEQQLAILKPQIVICGATWHLFKSSAEKHNGGRRFEPVFDETIFKRGSTHFIDFWHPAYRVPHEMTFHYLQSIVRGAGGSALWRDYVPTH